MKTFICLIITCVIFCGALSGALNAKNPFPAFGVAFLAWALLSAIATGARSGTKRGVQGNKSWTIILVPNGADPIERF